MNQNPGGGESEPGGGDAPLHEALDDLEHMLGPGGIPATGSGTVPAGRGAPYDASHAPESADFTSPARRTPGASFRPVEPAGTTGIEAWDPARYRTAAERLASEVEIIMNARLEAALTSLGEDLRRELRNHIEIVLPEIVSTLAEDDIPPRYE